VTANDTIKVGILHSLSGTMASSEKPLKDVLLMLIQKQNEQGGLLGKQLEPVVVDPASQWPLYAEKARRLVDRDKVVAIFGCWTSASRKAVIPVIENSDSMLFYPVQYEGQESSGNIFYFGATPNQQALPAISFLLNEKSAQRWILIGTDYVYPRTINKIIVSYLKSIGVHSDDIMLRYSTFGQVDWSRIVSDIKKFGSAGKNTVVVSTINGDANIHFYEEIEKQSIKASQIPVMAFSVGEQELGSRDTFGMNGNLTAWNYFMAVDSLSNRRFIQNWREFTGNNAAVTNDPMEAHYIGFNMWVKAVEKVGSTDVDLVRDAMIGVTVANLSGSETEMLPNHHITKPVYIGKFHADKGYKIAWKDSELVAGDAWSNHLDESRDLISDWTAKLNCGKYHIGRELCLDY